MANTSAYDVPILVEFRKGRPDKVPGRIVLAVVDARGQPVALTEYGQANRVEPDQVRQRGHTARTLKPSDIYREVVDLGREFELRAPGTYQVEAQKRDAVSGAIIRSNKITFRVVP
jgi:hypothetical protein